MNCKQGDLAIVVKSNFGNEGRIVQCIRLATLEDYKHFRVYDAKEPAWVVDAILKAEKWPVPLCRDSQLRPLRDSDGEDEMLRIAGKPEKATA